MTDEQRQRVEEALRVAGLTKQTLGFPLMHDRLAKGIADEICAHRDQCLVWLAEAYRELEREVAEATAKGLELAAMEQKK